MFTKNFNYVVFTSLILLLSQVSLSNESLVLEPLSCSKEDGVKSQNGEVKAKIYFINGTPDDVIIHWVNYQGKRDLKPNQITTIAPDMSARKITYLTHPFIVTDSKGKCLGVYISQSVDNIVFIK